MWKNVRKKGIFDRNFAGSDRGEIFLCNTMLTGLVRVGLKREFSGLKGILKEKR
jgi:hypothetical protein